MTGSTDGRRGGRTELHGALAHRRAAIRTRAASQADCRWGVCCTFRSEGGVQGGRREKRQAVRRTRVR